MCPLVGLHRSANYIPVGTPMNTHNLSKQERIQLVLEGVLSQDYITHEEVLEVLDTLSELVVRNAQTHYSPDTLQ
jgi:hypothetical protein